MNFGKIRMPHLRHFIAVASEKNITRAAEILGTVQPGVSRTIRELEEIVGTPLFMRTGDGLLLTPAGEIFHKYVSDGLGQITLGLNALSGRSSGNRVVVYALPNVTRTIMPGAVARFSSLYPDVQIRLFSQSLEKLTSLVRSGDIDFGCGRLAAVPDMNGLHFEHLYSEPLCFFVRSGHPLCARQAVSLSDIGQFQVVLPLEGVVIRQELDQFLVARGFPGFRYLVESMSFEFSRDLMHVSDAVVFNPRGAMRLELETGRAIALDLGIEDLTGPVGLTTRADSEPTEAARLLMDMVRDEAHRLDLV